MKRLLEKSKSVLWGIAVCGFILLQLSCSDQPKKNSIQSVPVQDYPVPSVEYHSTDSLKKDTTKSNEKTVSVMSNQTTTDSYDDGYLDGEAMSEEDRLAGKPGMQVGMDDDEEDYEDGYDDGYEEE